MSLPHRRPKQNILSVLSPRKWQVLRPELLPCELENLKNSIEINGEHFVKHITIRIIHPSIQGRAWAEVYPTPSPSGDFGCFNYIKGICKSLGFGLRLGLGDPVAPRVSWLGRGWKDRAKVKSIACNASPFPERPHASLCSQAVAFRLPPGRTKPPFRPVPAAIVQSRSNLFLLAARCEVTQPFPCYSDTHLCKVCADKRIQLFCLVLSIWEKVRNPELILSPRWSVRHKCTRFWRTESRYMVFKKNAGQTLVKGTFRQFL